MNPANHKNHISHRNHSSGNGRGFYAIRPEVSYSRPENPYDRPEVSYERPEDPYDLPE
ncbi:MAG: hypothetical protein LBH90_07280 [Tannerella sp.]|nr:hypothetical protein [Tannerella sp.]